MKRNASHKTSGAGKDATWSNIVSSCTGAGDERGGCFVHSTYNNTHCLIILDTRAHTLYSVDHVHIQYSNNNDVNQLQNQLL